MTYVENGVNSGRNDVINSLTVIAFHLL